MAGIECCVIIFGLMDIWATSDNFPRLTRRMSNIDSLSSAVLSKQKNKTVSPNNNLWQSYNSSDNVNTCSSLYISIWFMWSHFTSPKSILDQRKNYNKKPGYAALCLYFQFFPIFCCLPFFWAAMRTFLFFLLFCQPSKEKLGKQICWKCALT